MVRCSCDAPSQHVAPSGGAPHPQRVALCDAVYANLGLLMSVLRTEAQRPQIAAFFELNLLRETGPEEEEPPVIPPTPPTPPTP